MVRLEKVAFTNILTNKRLKYSGRCRGVSKKQDKYRRGQIPTLYGENTLGGVTVSPFGGLVRQAQNHEHQQRCYCSNKETTVKVTRK